MKEHPTILVVEDEAITGMYLEMTLRMHGYIVNEIAATGEDAIAFAKESKPWAILMDIRLAGKMDGIEAAKTIRSFCDSHIIFMTGYSDDKIKDLAGTIPNTSFYIKPVETKDLILAIQSAVSSMAPS